MVTNMIRNGSGLLPLSFFVELHFILLLFLKFHSFFLHLVKNHIPESFVAVLEGGTSFLEDN